MHVWHPFTWSNRSNSARSLALGWPWAWCLAGAVLGTNGKKIEMVDGDIIGYSTAICIFFEGGPPIHLLILFLLLVRNLNKGLPILQLLVHLHLQLWPTHAWRHPAQEARYLLYYQWWVPWYSEMYNLCLPTGMQPPLETPPNNSSLYRLAVLQSPTFPASKSGLPGRSSIWTACCLAGDGAASEILGNTEASWTGMMLMQHQVKQVQCPQPMHGPCFLDCSL